MIDHNLAFGSDTPAEFWHYHIFRDDRPGLTGLKAQKLPVMQRIIDDLPQFWSELPQEWTDVCNTELNQVDKILRRCLSDEFWV